MQNDRPQLLLVNPTENLSNERMKYSNKNRFQSMILIGLGICSENNMLRGKTKITKTNQIKVRGIPFPVPKFPDAGSLFGHSWSAALL